MVDIPERSGTASVSEVIGAIAASTGEDAAEVSILHGYGSVFHDRTGYAEITENIGVGATSTREDYAEVSILHGYGSVFHDRTSYANVSENIGVPGPAYMEVASAQRGWGTPLRAMQMLKVYPEAAVDTASVSVTQGVIPTVFGGGDHASVSEGDLVVPQDLRHDQILADSPEAYYRLSEASGTQMVDSSGNERHGVYTGAVTLNVPGLVPDDPDTAADFSGGWGQVPSGSWMYSQEFTIEATIRPRSLPSGQHVIVGRHTNPGWMLFQTSNRIGWATWQSGWREVLSNTLIEVGTTHHVAATFSAAEGNMKRLYLNGEEDISVTYWRPHDPATPPLSIGHFGDGFSPGGYFDGVIDEVAFFARLLPADRILAHAVR